MYGNENFYDLKGSIENIFDAVGIKSYLFVPNDTNQVFHPGRSAFVMANNKQIGIIGQIHPNVAENFESADNLLIAEINIDMLTDMANQLQSVHFRHVQIQQNQLGPVVGTGNKFQRSLPIVAGSHPVISEISQHARKQLEHERLVIEHQYPDSFLIGHKRTSDNLTVAHRPFYFAFARAPFSAMTLAPAESTPSSHSRIQECLDGTTRVRSPKPSPRRTAFAPRRRPSMS